MRAPVPADPAAPPARQPDEDEVSARQPDWPAADILALSFVYGLPREKLYPLLRGEPIAADTPDEPPPRAGGGRREAALSAEARSGEADGGDGLAELLRRLGCAEPCRRAEAARDAAARAVARARETGIQVVPWLDARYPPLLARIFDPPLVLWIRGAVEDLPAPAVAVVGSRVASVYGEETAARIASGLAARGLTIVSGLARGIDAAAHRGALASRGRTIGVLGCGADVVYPPEHRELMEEVARSGAVASELPPGTPPCRMHFPRRNRIISGLSRAVVVVEARQRSGALITADCALEQGREVMAAPGSVLSERHRGSHALLKAGAALVETADDVLDALRMAGGRAATAPVEVPPDRVAAAMETGEPYGIDALAAMSGEDVATLLPRLLELELQGWVRRVPGGRFVRVRRNVLT